VINTRTTCFFHADTLLTPSSFIGNSSSSLRGTQDEVGTGCGAHDVDVLGAESVAHAADANSESDFNSVADTNVFAVADAADNDKAET